MALMHQVKFKEYLFFETEFNMEAMLLKVVLHHTFTNEYLLFLCK